VALIELRAEVEHVDGRDVTVVLPETARRIQRRDFARIAGDLPVVLLVPRPSGRAAMQRATTVDVSAGGAAVRMAHPPPAGTRAPFVLRCGEDLEVTGVAFVIDSTEERRDRHRVRLRFDQLRPVDREALASWVFRRQVDQR
jgi:c-di-GMP-binding flagellar brake protein YcgR